MTDGVTTEHGIDPHRDDGEVACPHCGGMNAKTPAAAIIDCAHCDRSFAPLRPPSLARQRAVGTSHGEDTRSPTDVGLVLSGTVAAAIATLFYVAVVEPLRATYFGELFGARGWVPYVITWLSAWAGVLLAAKTRLLSVQRKALALDLLPDSIAARITPHNAATFALHVRGLAEQELAPRGALGSRSLLARRIERALEHYRMRSNATDVIAQLGNQSQLDANAVDSSYTMIRVFIWAIPLLGFIGTVLGISASVAGFSTSLDVAADFGVVKDSLGAVTLGLGIAFDTTLLALVMSILIMFPASALQKSEEGFLDRVETYCEERLGRRLGASTPAARGDVPDEEAFASFATLAEGVAHSLASLESQLAQLGETARGLDQRLAPTRDAAAQSPSGSPDETT